MSTNVVPTNDYFASSPMAAYRDDLTGRDDQRPFTDHDGVWLLLATLIVRAKSPDGLTSAALDPMAAIARQHLGAARIRRGCRHDPTDARRGSAINACRIIAEEMEQFGALRLAASFVDALQNISDLSAVDRGRLIAQRARIAWKRGDAHGASDRYDQVERLAELNGDDELHIRAWVGRVALAQVRGNYPEAEHFANLAFRLAEQHTFARLGALARMGLLACAAHRRDFPGALAHAWSIFETVRGDEIAEAEILANMGRLLLDMNQTQAAQAAFTRVVSRSRVPRIVLPALSGLALASAITGDHATMHWAVRQVLAGERNGTPLYESAAALYECAQALLVVGDDAEAMLLRDRAMALATRHGYHEVGYRADELRPAEAQAAISERKDTRAIVRRVLQFRQRKLPIVTCLTATSRD